MSSSDGFCSTLSFTPGELGQPYTPPVSTTQQTGTSGVQSTCHATPVAPAPPASPARSNSVSSIATQSTAAQQATGSVVNNPTPTLGSVPLVTATHSSQPPTLPLTTPPQTPASQSGTSTVSNSVLGKRASESEKEEIKDQGSVPQVQPPKKRRVAPTLISSGNDASVSKDGTQNTDVGG
jgi:chromatin assembly factor 1 subunit B